MSDKPTKEQDPGGASPAGADPDSSVYGGRWGPGATATPHNQPGSIANDPASAPPPPTRREEPTPMAPEADPSLAAGEDEAAQRERQEQRWDSEGGAASTRPDGG